MHLGVAIFNTDRSIRPDELAPEVESRGFESLFVPEHTHMPVDHSPWPRGPELPEEYRRILDPFVALATAAAVTSTLKLGTGVCLVAQRDPLLLAKEVATLDLLSDGRFLFGIGYGWNAPELEHHGPSFAERREVVREYVLAMKALWTEDAASFAGTHVDFAPSWSLPKPVQQPHPPILLGAAAGPRTFAHLAELCDGWLPMGASKLEERLEAMRQAVSSAGRDPDTIEVTVFGTRPEPGMIEHLAELGVDRAVLWLPPAERDEALAALDSFAALLGHAG